MKKLMIAASAALCATVGFSDVTSANIVGYNTELVNSNKMLAQNKMIGVPFLTVSSAEGCKVTDLKLDGYQDSATWQRGGFTQSYIQIIKSNGTADQKFTWIDNYVNDVWEGGYWRNSKTGKKVVETVTNPDTEEAPFLIPAGTGLWCNFQKAADDKKIRLVTAGEVLQPSLTVLCNSNKMLAQNKAICNPLARAVDLTEVKLTGYQESATWQRGGFTQSYIQIIKSNGTADQKFTWIDNYVNDVWEGGYWRNSKTGKKVVKVVANLDTEETASLPAGQGLWCNFQKAADDKKIYIVWPTLAGDAK